ncbi:hypothetical protein WJX73_002557 [Symbiochloris irregularis]|uniref:Uncharacterized protein n=1 Tax=Symbiochloris irregularis TaxID=706552 RepID=A0AAW1PAW9_9CHLO
MLASAAAAAAPSNKTDDGDAASYGPWIDLPITGQLEKQSKLCFAHSVVVKGRPELYVAGNSHGADRFVVKLVCNYQPEYYLLGRDDGKLCGNTGMLLLDESSSMSYSVYPDDAAYQPLFQLIEERGARGGTKIYLWCKRPSQSSLRVFLEGLPPQSQSW